VLADWPTEQYRSRRCRHVVRDRRRRQVKVVPRRPVPVEQPHLGELLECPTDVCDERPLAVRRWRTAIEHPRPVIDHGVEERRRQPQARHTVPEQMGFEVVQRRVRLLQDRARRAAEERHPQLEVEASNAIDECRRNRWRGLGARSRPPGPGARCHDASRGRPSARRSCGGVHDAGDLSPRPGRAAARRCARHGRRHGALPSRVGRDHGATRRTASSRSPPVVRTRPRPRREGMKAFLAAGSRIDRHVRGAGLEHRQDAHDKADRRGPWTATRVQPPAQRGQPGSQLTRARTRAGRS